MSKRGEAHLQAIDEHAQDFSEERQRTVALIAAALAGIGQVSKVEARELAWSAWNIYEEVASEEFHRRATRDEIEDEDPTAFDRLSVGNAPSLSGNPAAQRADLVGFPGVPPDSPNNYLGITNATPSLALTGAAPPPTPR